MCRTQVCRRLIQDGLFTQQRFAKKSSGYSPTSLPKSDSCTKCCTQLSIVSGNLSNQPKTHSCSLVGFMSDHSYMHTHILLCVQPEVCRTAPKFDSTSKVFRAKGVERVGVQAVWETSLVAGNHLYSWWKGCMRESSHKYDYILHTTWLTVTTDS